MPDHVFQGLSVDGTTEYLDDLARRHPQRVRVHRRCACSGVLERELLRVVVGC